MNKQAIVSEIESFLQIKKAGTQTEMAAIQASANSDTKSSAGDKYETSRAMAQIEIDRLKTNLLVIEGQIAGLERISNTKISDKALFGALVSTNRGLFLLGIGLGKIEISVGSLFAVSMESPLGQNIKGKRIGDSFMLAAQVCTIISIE